MRATNGSTRTLVSNRRLWFGVAAATTAWAVHGMASFVISDAACAHGRVAGWAGISTGGLRGILIMVTIAMLALAITGGVVAWRSWRVLATSRLDDVQAWGRREFMAVVGVFVSVVFSLGIIWGGLAPIFTGLCEATR